MELLQDEDVQWRVINSHFETYGHAHHQIEGMEHFMKALLPHIVKEQETISLEVGRQKHLIHIKNVTIVPPNFKEVKEGMVHAMTSHEARKRGLDLTTPVLMTLEHEIQSFNEEEELISHTITPYVDVPLCRIPAMVGMRYAGYKDHSVSPYDEGGYFVINGIEKVLIPQLKLRINIPFVWSGRLPGKYLWTGEVRSCHPTKYRSTSTLKVCLAQPKKGQKIPTLVSLVPFVSKGSTPLEIPLRYMFRILLVDDVDAILAMVDDAETNDIIRHSLEADDKTKEDILDWVGVNGTKEKTKEKQRKYVMHIFVNEYFPHLGMNENPDTLQRKAWFLAYMCRRVVRVHLGKEKVDDRDSYKIKRLDGPGPLLAVLFRQHYRNFIKQFKMSVTRDIESGKTYVSILDHINSSRITAALLYHFKTGNWSLVSKTKYTGVVQQLSRITRAATNSHLRRLGTPMVNKDGKSTIPRMIHADDFGINCIVETPEGAPVGLVKNLALVTYLAIGSSAELLERHIKEVFSIEPMGEDIPTMVFVNGYMIGKTKDPKTLVEQLIELRRCEDIPFDTSIMQNPSDGHVLIYSDCGRCIRPVYVLKNLYKFSNLYASCSSHELWLQLRVNGVIEYLDKMEENARCLVAMRPNEVEPYHTHLELHPSVMFGLTGCDEVFPERNQAPRNMYQASMGKQAIGVSTLNYQDRFDMHQLVLDYPQRPLVTTRIQGIRKQGALPSAQEVVVAIMCYGGFNQEDAVLINQSALDRGLFSTTKYVVYTDDLGDRGTEDEVFCNPSSIKQLKNRNGAANYSKLEEDGFVAVGVKVEPNDVIIGKVMASVEVDEFGNQVEVKRCKSTVVKKGDGGYIDKVMLTTNRDGNQMVRVKIRSRKVPIIGDKLSSRHGQKGTIGMTYRQEDMPFCLDGMTPDIIVNPNALPSRMTIGQLMECLLSKTCAISGAYGDGTAFRRVSAEDIADELQSHGFHRYGNQVMHNGFTGEMIETNIFIGTTCYQRLKHRVEDKVHARAKGRTTLLTRQPSEGRSNEGGLRFGEMERDALLSHGSTQFILDRLFHCSDPYSIPVCDRCGLIGVPASNKQFGATIHGKARCCNRSCHGNCWTINIPYSMKLLLQEMQAMGVAMRLRLKKTDDFTLKCVGLG